MGSAAGYRHGELSQSQFLKNVLPLFSEHAINRFGVCYLPRQGRLYGGVNYCRYLYYQRDLRAFQRRGKQKFSRQLFDHSTFMAPVNMFMTGLSRLPPKQAFFDSTEFPELAKLTDNWQAIRKEAVRLQDHIKASQSHNDAGFNTFFKRGWKRFYLKWYGDAHPQPKRCAR